MDLFAAGVKGEIVQARLKAKLSKWNPIKTLTVSVKSHHEEALYEFAPLHIKGAAAQGEWVYQVKKSAKRGGAANAPSLYNIFLGALTFACMTSVVMLMHCCTRKTAVKNSVEAFEDEDNEGYSNNNSGSGNYEYGGGYQQQQQQGSYGSYDDDSTPRGGAFHSFGGGGGYGNDNGASNKKRYDFGYDDDRYSDGATSPDYTSDRYGDSGGSSRLDVV